MKHTGFSLLHWGWIRPNPGWEMPLHGHQHHELIVILAGRMRVVGGDGTEVAGSVGDLLLYPSGHAHAEFSDHGLPVQTVYFGFTGPLAGGLRSVRDREGRVECMCRWLEETRTDYPADHDRLVGPYFEAIIAETLRCEAGEHGSPLANAVRRWMQAHLGSDVSLEDMAEAVSLSKYHFVRRYRELTGSSPMADLRRVRLEEAHRLVLSTDLPLKAIARRVGMADEHSLSRAFSKRFGMSPREYR